MAKQKTSNTVLMFLAKNYLYLGLLIATMAFAGSLIFSEVLKFIPCELCWYQRILMYPQLVLFGVAVMKNDKNVVHYVLPLSVIGLLIAVYHYLLQLNPTILPCTDEIANCALREFNLFGFITIPFLSMLAFGALVVLSIISKKYSR
jgi:disulfide bond formation protein DsbB